MLRLALITTDNREDRRDYTPERPWFGTAVQALLDGFAGLPGEVEVHVVSCARRRLPTPLRLAENMVFHSVRVPAWAWLKSGYLGNIMAVRKLLATIRPDLVHGQGTERDCAMAAVFSGYPNVITLHGNMRQLAQSTGAKPWSFVGLTARLESVALRHAGGVICLSQHARRLAETQARATWTVPNAVDPALLKLRNHAAPERPLILMIGDLLPNKNQLAFLQAIAPLQDEHGFHVRLFGKAADDDAYAMRVRAFVADHPWCEFGGFLTREALRRELASATLLALASLEENLPMVILEAMAAGLPVVASNAGGIPDLIHDARTGRLFDPHDESSVRMAVGNLLGDATLRSRLARNARERIVRHHLPATIARDHLPAYQEIIRAAA